MQLSQNAAPAVDGATTKKSSAKFLIGGAIIAATIFALVGWAMTRPGSTAFYLTTTEVVKRGPTFGSDAYRVNGNVVAGTVERNGLESTFAITDGDTQLTVHTDRPLPDAFRDDNDTQIVALGTFDGRNFNASEVLAKCPSKFKAQS
jgi:cytochrome c-type biogenesis protein CcmE